MMLQKYVLRVAAWLEILNAIALIMTPELLGQLLFGAQFESAGELMARWAQPVCQRPQQRRASAPYRDFSSTTSE
jgi:hypothetical protein